jgi:hypothetical protein
MPLAVAFLRMSRSWRKISFSRRSRLSSAMTSSWGGVAHEGRVSWCSAIQRASVERFTPRSSAMARWERPLVKTRRTASS